MLRAANIQRWVNVKACEIDCIHSRLLIFFLGDHLHCYYLAGIVSLTCTFGPLFGKVQTALGSSKLTCSKFNVGELVSRKWQVGVTCALGLSVFITFALMTTIADSSTALPSPNDSNDEVIATQGTMP